MRGAFLDQGELFSYISPEARVPKNHPLRTIREVVRDVCEVMQATQHSKGTYDFRIRNPPTSEDEPRWIEWSSDEPVIAGEILEQLANGLRDHGIQEVFVLEAAAALLPHLPKVDGNLLQDSMRKLLEADQAHRKDIHRLPKRIRKLIEQLKGAAVRQ